MKASRPRPSGFWWKCRVCGQPSRRMHHMKGTAWCPHCDSVSHATQVACWGHEWKAVAFMAFCIHKWCPAEGAAQWVTKEMQSSGEE